MGVNIRSIAEEIIHEAGTSISHSAGTGITHTAGTTIQHTAAAAINHTAGTLINHNAGAIANINSSQVNVRGMNKNLVPGAASVLSNFTSLTSVLSLAQSAFSGGGLTGIVSGLMSSLGSVSSITSAFGSISSLASGLSAFTSLGSALSSVTSLMSSGSSSAQSAAGSMGALSSASGTFNALSGVTALSGVSSNLTNLASIPADSSVSSLSSVDSSTGTMNNSLAVASALQGLGVYLSQPGSSATVLELQQLMQDINNIVSQSLSNGVTLTYGGSAQQYDQIAFTIANSGIGGSPRTVNYAVGAVDTLSTIATGIAAAINADAPLLAAGFSATASGAAVTIIWPAVLGLITTYSGINAKVTATISGHEHNGDVLTINVIDSGLPGGSVPAQYTALPGDTLNGEAAGLAAAVNAAGLGTIASATGSVIEMISTSANSTSYSESVSVSGNEVITLFGAPTEIAAVAPLASLTTLATALGNIETLITARLTDVTAVIGAFTGLP